MRLSFEPTIQVVWLYVTALLIMSGGSLSCSRPSAGPPQRCAIRNVVLISLDTCRTDHLSCYGCPIKTTPVLDTIAADGVMFTQAQSTNPMTFPAHCSMFTGTIPPFHGVRSNFNYHLSDASITLAEILRDHDFQTAGFVGAFPLHSRFGIAQGFDTYGDEVGMDDGGDSYNQRKGEVVSAEAMAWLDRHGDSPFFLFLHYFDPHSPYKAPEPFASKFGTNAYAGEIGYTDHCVGQVIEKLKAMDLYDSSLIIVVGDHGEGLNEHHEMEHGFYIYQSTIRVPLIIRPPGYSSHRQVDDTVSVIDIVPTVLSLLDLSPPSQVQGVALTDYLFGQPEENQERAVYCETSWPMMYGCCPLRGIICDHWQYVSSIQPELYDLTADPAQLHNLFNEYPEKARNFHDQLETMLAGHSHADDNQVSAPLDEQAVARLRALGYVGGGAVVTELEFKPGMEDPKDFIHVFNRIWKADRYYKQHRLEQAKAACLEILNRKWEIPIVHGWLGDIAFEQKRLDDASTHYSNVLAVAEELTGDPSNSVIKFDYERVDAHINLGYVFFNQGKLSQAEDQFELALRIRPNQPEAMNNLGVVLKEQGRLDEAIERYRQVLQINPKDARGHANLAGALVKKGDLKDAIDHYREAILLNPDNMKARQHLAQTVKMLKATE